MERYRFHADGSVFFVTFSIVEWLPIFVSEAAFRIITESLNFCHANKGLRVHAYVIMPTHFHAILFHESFRAVPLETTVTDFRKFTGRKLADYCDQHLPACFRKVIRDAASDDRNRQIWQPSRHPEQIESERFWRQKIDYLHENPCRKGLVRRAVDWRFSSASYWLLDKPPVNDVVLTALDWE